jgi:hypothetical protein
VIPGATGSPSTVTFDVEWDRADLNLKTLWLDSIWVFVDYNKNGKMERLELSGGTLTAHSANTVTPSPLSPAAGTVIKLDGNDKGVWVVGDARTNAAGGFAFSATVQLYTKETDITIAGACAYASSYPPVSNWLSEVKLGFTGTPMYEITLTPSGGGTTITVEAGDSFLLPCSYTVSSFTDATGAPGIINCMPPTNLKFTPSMAAICAGATVTLTASADGAASYSINGTDWYASPVFEGSPVSPTSYTLYAKNAEGCVGSAADAAVVTITVAPKNPASPSADSRCGSGTVTFSADAGGNTIDWYDALTGGSTVTGGYDVLSFSPSINESTTYYAQARDAITGCVSASRLAVAGTVKPTPAISRTGGYASQGVIQNMAITNIVYTASGATSISLSSGNFPPGVTGNISSGTVCTISGMSSATGTFGYMLTASHTNGCPSVSASGTLTVAVPPPCAASTQTRVFGPQRWSDRMACGPSNCTSASTMSPNTVNPPAQYIYYSGNGRYYYNWTCVNVAQATMCPYPWRIPTQSDINTLLGNSTPAALISAWGFGGTHSVGSTPSAENTHGGYWSSTVYPSNTDEAYRLGYFRLDYDASLLTHSLKGHGYQARCVLD